MLSSSLSSVLLSLGLLLLLVPLPLLFFGDLGSPFVGSSPGSPAAATRKLLKRSMAAMTKNHNIAWDIESELVGTHCPMPSRNRYRNVLVLFALWLLALETLEGGAFFGSLPL